MIGADLWTDAPLIGIGETSDPTSNVGLTNTDDPGPDWIDLDRTAWWKVEGIDGALDIDASASTPAEVYLVAWRDDGGTLTEMGTLGSDDHVTLVTTPGATYYLQVGVEDGFEEDGDYVLSVAVEYYKALVLVDNASTVNAPGGDLLNAGTLTTVDEDYATFGRYVWVDDGAGGGFARPDSEIYTAFTQPASELPADAVIAAVRVQMTGRAQFHNGGITLYVVDDYANFTFSGTDEVTGVSPGWTTNFTFPATSWTSRLSGLGPTAPFTADEVRDGGAQVWVARKNGVPNVGNEVYITRLAFEVRYTSATGPGEPVEPPAVVGLGVIRQPPPLRIYPRSDGLGMSSARRVDANRSTQASLRRAGGTYF